MTKKRITFDELDSYISAINAAEDLDQVLDVLQKQINKFGLGKLSYWLRWSGHENNEPIFLSTYPDNFIEHYLNNDYQAHDMVGRLSTEKNTPFIWSDIQKELSITAIQEKLFDESASVGMRSGASIPIHGPNQIKATFSVANDANNADFEALFNFHRHEVHILATYAHEKIMRLSTEQPLSHINLTVKETEILTWVARGKTYWEIGIILTIQEDTVKKHMANICKKLNVSNSAHAVSKSVIHGLIVP